MLRGLVFLIGLVVGAAGPAAAEVRLVRAGENLQSALNAARAGDELRLQAGATFSGNFTLPVFAGTIAVTVRSDIPDAALPAPNQRVTPASAVPFAKIVSPNTAAAIATAPGAHHWRLLALELPNNKEGYGDILQIGDGSAAQSQVAQSPYEIVLDRLYIHGHPLFGQKRGIALNARATTIRNCYISDIKAVGADTQAIGGWNGPGPDRSRTTTWKRAGSVPARRIGSTDSEPRHRRRVASLQPDHASARVARSDPGAAGWRRRGAGSRRVAAGWYLQLPHRCETIGRRRDDRHVRCVGGDCGGVGRRVRRAHLDAGARRDAIPGVRPCRRR